jgi:phage gp37-like protein
MIGAIENAMIGVPVAAGVSGVLGYRYRTHETYPADWDDYFKEKTNWNAPAIWAVFAGATSMSLVGDDILVEGAQFGVVVAAESQRNEEATRHGFTASNGDRTPGSYQLATDVVRLLAGNSLGLDIQALQPRAFRMVRPSALMLERRASLIALQFETSFTLSPLDPDADLADFERLHLDWDVPPFGGVDGDLDADGIQLPAPATGPGSADASDTIELPQE